MDKEFCLLDEGWIKVLDEDFHIKEVSLCELFANAHRYQRLAGETATQDAAVLRVLLAIVLTVFYRTDADGYEDNVLDYDEPEEEILNRWKKYYDKGRFCERAFSAYLERYRERFYLFHPEFPFWQVPDLILGTYGTDCPVKCILGNIKESISSLTKHHFSVIDSKYIQSIKFPEVTRWLIHLNAYHGTIKRTKPAPGTRDDVKFGWLGQIGLIYVNGGNLFEQILLNLCALRDGETAWENPNPIWEQQEIDTRRGIKISMPDNLPQLYTIQSRRIKLVREGKEVTQFSFMGGDYFESENDITEQMTLYKEKEGYCLPQNHSREKYAWREFSSLFKGDRVPGIVLWLTVLKREKFINNGVLITYHMVGMKYIGQPTYRSWGDIIDDSLSMSAEFLSELGEPWIVRVKNQVEKCEGVADKQLDFFANNMVKAIYKVEEKRGGDFRKKVNAIKKSLVTQYFFLINNPFREWLAGISPETDMDDKEYAWERESYKYAKQVVDEYINKLDAGKLMLAMQGYRDFINGLNKLYRRREVEL